MIGQCIGRRNLALIDVEYCRQRKPILNTHLWTPNCLSVYQKKTLGVVADNFMKMSLYYSVVSKEKKFPGKKKERNGK